MKTFAFIVEYLKAAVGAKSEKALADMLGINYRTFATDKRRNSIPYEALINFCARMGIRLEAVFLDEKERISKGKGGEERSCRARPAIMLPIFDNVPPYFHEKVGEESIRQYVAFPDAGEDSFGLPVKDESMSPSLKPGDYAVFRRAKSFSNRELVVVNDRWGDSHIRRYRMSEGKIFLTPDNLEYPELVPGPDTQILGVLVAAWRKLKLS